MISAVLLKKSCHYDSCRIKILVWAFHLMSLLLYGLFIIVGLALFMAGRSYLSREWII